MTSLLTKMNEKSFLLLKNSILACMINLFALLVHEHVALYSVMLCSTCIYILIY